MDGAQTFIRNGLAQTDLDMNHFRLLNLDTSNLPPSGIPPTVTVPAHNWLDGWDSGDLAWHYSQPDFRDLSGRLTQNQMRNITETGAIRGNFSFWQANPIERIYLPSLDGITIPADNVNLNNKRITNLADPVNGQDAVNLRFMDNLLQGLNAKQAVRCASTFFRTRSGLKPDVDGVVLAEGDRVLLKDLERIFNGIWIASNGAWTRAPDADHGTDDTGVLPSNDINRAYTVVLEGEINGGTSWLESKAVSHVDGLGASDIEFVIFNTGSNANIAGDGLDRVGNTLNVGAGTGIQVNADSVQIDPDYPGQPSIETVGTITTGVWNGTLLDSEFGGTGVNNQGQTLTLLEASLSVQKVGLVVPDSNVILQVQGGSSIVNLPVSGTLSTLAGTETFTNKRLTKRVATTPSSATPAINTDDLDAFYITALAGDITSMTSGLTGTPTRGQELEIWITNAAIVDKNITWGSAWAASTDLALPTVAHTGKTVAMKFSYNPDLTKWVLTDKLENI